MAKTIREIINEFRTELSLPAELSDSRANEILIQLSALYGNVNEEIRRRDYEYNQIFLKYLEIEEKANRAKIKAECSPEFLLRKEARDEKESVKELISSLKYFIRSKREEYQVSHNL